MCQYFSCIVTKDLKVHWLPSNPCDHEAVINKLRLEDTKLQFRDFVRIEISPKDTSKVTRSIRDWQLKVDEPATLPEWFVEKQKEAEKNCFVALKESMQINIALGDENKGEVRDTYLMLRENSQVVAWGNSQVVAWGNSKVVAWGNSKVVARENSQVVARGNSKVEAWENSQVEARGNSKVEARENSTVEAWGNSKVVAWENSKVEARENSKVEIKSTLAVVLSNGKIFVHTDAEVVKTSKVGPE
jgi:hypothetical protein